MFLIFILRKEKKKKKKKKNRWRAGHGETTSMKVTDWKEDPDCFSTPSELLHQIQLLCKARKAAKRQGKNIWHFHLKLRHLDGNHLALKRIRMNEWKVVKIKEWREPVGSCDEQTYYVAKWLMQSYRSPVQRINRATTRFTQWKVNKVDNPPALKYQVDHFE